MKTVKQILLIGLLAAPFLSFSQSDKTKTDKPASYQRKTTRVTSRTDTIRKQNAPVLEDNGTVNTTGIVDRSSTGRPGADTLVNYTVRKKKRIQTTGGLLLPDTTKRRKD